MPTKRTNLVKPFFQVGFLSLGLLCGLSRIFDYWHHWGDVLVGLFLGAIVAFFIVSFKTPDNMFIMIALPLLLT